MLKYTNSDQINANATVSIKPGTQSQTVSPPVATS